MIYFESTITVLLKEDIYLNRAGEAEGELLKAAMPLSDHLKELHAQRGIKLYCYDYMYPRAEEKRYLKNRVYYFKMRTPVEQTANEFSKVLNGFETERFKVVGCQHQKKKFHEKTEIYTTTPAICTLGRQYWQLEHGMDSVQEKIEKNLVSKYQVYFRETPERDSGFINYLQLKNKKPITVKYKTGSLVGNKFVIGFDADEVSQKMAFLAYTTSILEKSSSLGSGFCI